MRTQDISTYRWYYMHSVGTVWLKHFLVPEITLVKTILRHFRQQKSYCKLKTSSACTNNMRGTATCLQIRHHATLVVAWIEISAKELERPACWCWSTIASGHLTLHVQHLYRQTRQAPLQFTTILVDSRHVVRCARHCADGTAKHVHSRCCCRR